MSGWCALAAAGALAGLSFDTASAQCNYEVVGIVQAQPCPFTGPPATYALGLSNNGIVVGRYEFCETAGNEAFIWTPNPDGEGGVFKTLPRPDGITSASANGVNSAGFVIGSHTFAAGGTRGFIYNPDTQEFKYLEALDPDVTHGTISTLNAINESNVAVGSRRFSPPGAQPPVFNAVIWHPFGIDGEGPEVVIDLGDFGVGPNSEARAINEVGVVCGWTGPTNISGFAFVRIADQEMFVLDSTWGVKHSICQCLDSNGLAAGGLELESPNVFKAFTWDMRSVVTIDPPPGFTDTGAAGLNDMGQILIRIVPGLVPAIVQHGKVTLLEDLIDPPMNVVIDQPRRINNDGEILLRGYASGRMVGLLTAPVDRPVTDLNADCVTDIHDLLMLLEQWGRCDGCTADFTGSGTVGVPDLLFLLSNWG